MKKPFLVLKGAGDYFKLALCITLCLSALCLFFRPQKSVAAFSDGVHNTPRSLYSLVGSLI